MKSNSIKIKAAGELTLDLPPGDWPQRISADALLEKIQDMHVNNQDWEVGDLYDRVMAFGSYHLCLLPLGSIDHEEWSFCPDLASEYAARTEVFPPIVYDQTLDSIIDGTHRVNAALLRKDCAIWAYVGQSFED